LTISGGNQPTFFVIGAQKSATTWLYGCLDEHPEVAVPVQKEVHYYCDEHACRFSTKARGMDWYRTQFPVTEQTVAFGELTTDYMFYPTIVSDLYQLNSQAKIIALLRNPIDRAYSAYWMWRRHKNDLPEFSAMIRSPKQTGLQNNFIERGLYFKQLVPYVNQFGRENVKVYILEEVQASPEKFISELYEFLGVDTSFKPKDLHRKISATKVLPGVFGRFVYKIVSPLLNAPGIRTVWRYLRRNTSLKEALDKLLRSKVKVEYREMSEEDRNYLRERFAEDYAALANLLGRKITTWDFD